MNKKILLASSFFCLLGLSAHAQAITTTFTFTGECDDCAFSGDPGVEGFNPLNDGLTESVSATLALSGLSLDGNMIDFRGAGSVVFSYGGSSLINPFTMADPYQFSPGLMKNGTVADGFVFSLASSQNYTNPSNPLDFDFPNFCTSLGQQVLGYYACNDVGLVTFMLDSAGAWSISGEEPFDLGFDGQLSPLSLSAVPLPGALVMFSSGLIGLLGFVRTRAARNA